MAAVPLRAAAVDIGSNAMRFLAAEFTAPACRSILREVRVPLRLGHDVFRVGRIEEHTAAAALRTLSGFRSLLEELKISRYRAVATSAVREAANRGDFLRSVRSEAGVRLELISGSEEARIVHRAVRDLVPREREPWISLELGGGSAELALCDKRKILWSETHGLGAVRLLETFTEAGGDPSRFRRLLEEYLASMQKPRELARLRPKAFVATGGNIEALARLCGAAADGGGTVVLPLEAMRESIERLTRLAPRDRVRLLGLREDRADVILPAALVYERIAVLFGFTDMLVPSVGVRDGILQECADRAFGRSGSRAAGTVVHAAALARKYRADGAHARQVAHLALGLFDQTAPLHGLGKRERRILAAAAVLHDIGMFIGMKSHHKNSFLLISRSELPGFSPHGMRLAALVARYHRKAEPSECHPAFAALSPADRCVVASLAALLRIADAMDREHGGQVRSLRVEIRADGVTVHAETTGDLLIERWAVERKGLLFQKTFGTPLRIAGGKEAPP